MSSLTAVVSANGSGGGAGIGGDGGIDDPRASVTINGGCVTARGGRGVIGGRGSGDSSETCYMSMGCGAGIGSGAACGQDINSKYEYENQNNITVTVNGGCVTALGGYEQILGSGAGIGGGCKKAGGSVFINGGKILATGGGSGSVSGIGSGIDGDGGGGSGKTSLCLGIGVTLCGSDSGSDNATQKKESEEDGTIVDWDRLPHFMWTNPDEKPSLWIKDPSATKEDSGTNSCSEYNVIKDNYILNLSSGWCSDWKTRFYAVEGDVTVSKRIEVTGDMNLILCDGATLTASEGIYVPEDSSLTIYEGSMESEIIEGTGFLKADASSVNNAAGIGGNSGKGGAVIIYGGSVIAAGGNGAAGIGTKDAAVSISGNSVKAIGGSNAWGIDGSLKVNGNYVYKTSEDGSSWTEQEIPSSREIDERYRCMALCIHKLSYSADGAVITAVCPHKACFFKDQKATLTIAEPLHTVYGDGNSPEAVITDEEGIRGNADIIYYAIDDSENKTGSALGSAPTDPGEYRAEITIEEGAATAYVVYTIEKADVSLDDDNMPHARTGLIYNGSPQELVTPGKAVSGTFYYAPGNEAEAEKPYTTSVPTAVNAGTYCVWYKVSGNEYHKESEAQRVDIVIDKAVKEDVTVSGTAEYGNSGKIDIRTLIEEGGIIDNDGITITDGQECLDGNPLVSDGYLEFSFADKKEIAGKTATVSVPVKDTENYKDYNIIASLRVGEKDVPIDEDPIDKEDQGKNGKVPLSEPGAYYASSKDNFAAIAGSGKTGRLVLDFSKVASSDVDPKGLKMTAVKGNRFSTKDRLRDKYSASSTGGVRVKVNSSTLIPSITCKKSGRVTLTMEDGETYSVYFNVQKPKARDSAKTLSKESSPVTKSIKDLFGTDIDAGKLFIIYEKNPGQASISDNKLYLDPEKKDRIKLLYVYLDKKYRITIKVK